tara:strand:- start:80 stop:1045 length:966 start_codon:yes stop_codon:yes gene_type:complete
MAKPNTRQTFSDYCLRSLGAPVIEINVDEDQIDDRIDEALQFYQFYHADSIEKFYLKHKVTNSTLTLTASVAGNFQVGETITGGTSGAKAVIKTAAATKITYNQLDDTNVAFAANETITGDTTSATATISSISKGDIENGYIALNDAITDVVRVMPIRDSVTSTDMFDIRYQIHLNDIHSVGFMGNLTEYVMSRQFLSLLDVVVDSDHKQINFDRHKNRLDIFMDWDEEVDVDDYLVVECYRIIDPDTFTDVYNDYFLKRYATALIKRQWGTNLLKFEGMVMPGGVTFNGRQLFDDANEEITRLEEEARLNWEQPIDFMTG